MSRVSIRTTRILVAFCDLTGFGSYVKKASRDQREYNRFIKSLFKEFSKFRRDKYFWVKLMGDGFMVIRELDKADRPNSFLARNLLCRMGRLSRRVYKMIDSIPYDPKPKGFRVRITSGTCSVVSDLQPKELKDFYGHEIDTCARLLDVRREIPLICHESVKDLLDREDARKFKFIKVPYAHGSHLNVEEEDRRALWSYECAKSVKRVGRQIRYKN